MKALQWPKLQPLVAKILAVAETSNFWWLFFGKALVTHERRAVAEISMFGGRPLPDDWQLLPVEPTFAQRPLIMIRMANDGLKHKYKYKYKYIYIYIPIQILLLVEPIFAQRPLIMIRIVRMTSV